MQAQAELGFIVVHDRRHGHVQPLQGVSRRRVEARWRRRLPGPHPVAQGCRREVPVLRQSRRVGIYGGSAGGQNSTGALLFHPDFYKVAVSYAGCHDNRMDKIVWNERWMGWPIDDHYAESSNVDNAWRLQGKLLLVVGELDQNVDPASTMQVVNALIKANKMFDLLVIPGGEPRRRPYQRAGGLWIAPAIRLLRAPSSRRRAARHEQDAGVADDRESRDGSRTSEGNQPWSRCSSPSVSAAAVALALARVPRRHVAQRPEWTGSPRRSTGPRSGSIRTRSSSTTASGSSWSRTIACRASPRPSSTGSARCRSATASTARRTSSSTRCIRARRRSASRTASSIASCCGEIYDTEQELLAERNAHRNGLRERNVFYNEGDWPITEKEQQLRQKLYELEDEQSKNRIFWEEYNWYRRNGGLMRHSDPVPANTGNELLRIEVDLPKERLEMFFRLEADRMVNAVLRGWEAQRFTVLEQFFVLQRNDTGRFQEALERRDRARAPDLHPHRRPPARPRVLEPRQHAPHVRRVHRAEQRDADAGRRHDRRRGADPGRRTTSDACRVRRRRPRTWTSRPSRRRAAASGSTGSSRSSRRCSSAIASLASAIPTVRSSTSSPGCCAAPMACSPLGARRALADRTGRPTPPARGRRTR